MRMHTYGLDWLHPEVWAGTTVSVLGRWSPQEMRDRRDSRMLPTASAGWHLTWMGGHGMEKQFRFGHAERNEEMTAERYEWHRQHGVSGRGVKLIRVNVDELRWPAGMQAAWESDWNTWRV